MPDAVRKSLGLRKTTDLRETFKDDTCLVLMKTADGFEEVPAGNPHGKPDRGEFYVFDFVEQPYSYWYGGFTYVDLMRKEVTELFLDVTLEAYREVIGEEFGRIVPGVFQDEAHIGPAGRGFELNWTLERRNWTWYLLCSCH